MENKNSPYRKLLIWVATSFVGIFIALSAFAAQDLYSRFKDVEKQCNTLDVMMEKIVNMQESLKEIKECCGK